jgi:hypothetical protein
MGYIDSPSVGNSSFHVIVADALGGTPAMLLVGAGQGSVSTGWGTFLLEPSGPVFSTVISMPGTAGAAGQGHLFIHAPIPNDPALVGASACLQALIQDASSSGGISHTNGLRVTVSA